ncbi:hypothetical protein C7384_1151 [Convivina intestini]|uniref:Uncharacterized protein n=2 Tax=Convivina TaxID=1697027 RepID=A0A2U1D3G3_9LACO|nr:hypothetical protein C7384_1151 [Convivina intestini]CAH1854532.1 hypothetical protein R077815_01074 [Convivina sp. LMG 32447]CAH1855804.1 hypothetical protein R078138_01214 [Convivina sp. LMG 32447]CAH1855889.1 hypothetical protein LMG032447_01188 [Convivina sp. LMG 32447]CAH1857547.1 hypothetical protein R077811_01573 [Convivina intestini]
MEWVLLVFSTVLLFVSFLMLISLNDRVEQLTNLLNGKVDRWEL